MKNTRHILLTLALLTLTGCSETRLYSNLPEQEVNEMVAILSISGIQCTKAEGDEGKWHITVADESYADAVAILSDAGRPKKHRPTMEDLFPKTGFTSSPAEQRIRLTYGLEQSLEATISALPGGVLDARVHIVTPENQPLRDSNKPSRASVVVIHKKGADVQNAVATIPQIVMGAIDGLEADNVSVELVESEDPILLDRASSVTQKPTPFQDILTIKVAKDSVPKFLGILAIFAIAVLLTVGQFAMKLLRPAK